MDNSKYLKIDSVSSCFCAAKWLQVTIYLQNGVNHSCHHPNTHRIPLELLSQNLNVFHNTPFKKEQQKMMLKGQRPSECSYCWNIEDKVGKYNSDRYIKSTDPWAYKFIDGIENGNNEEDVIPTYLEVSLGNECNFACSYCKADSSSRIHSELKQFGNYPTRADYGKLEWLESDNRLPLYSVEDNPYLPRFLEWFETIISKLEVFRVTGGEPLINSRFPKILEIIKSNSSQNLSFSVNSNLGIKQELVQKYCHEISKLIEFNKIKDDVTIFTSLESFGKQAEYIRHGLDINLFQKNVQYILEKTNFKIVFMVTYNILSIPKFNEFLEYLLALKKHFGASHTEGPRIVLDTSYLNSPNYMGVKYIGEDLLAMVKSSLDYIESNSSEDGVGFTKYEIEKFKRIYLWIRSIKKSNVIDEDEIQAKSDFVHFFDEYDKRKGLDLIKTFPELKKYYYECKLIIKEMRYFATQRVKQGI